MPRPTAATAASTALGPMSPPLSSPQLLQVGQARIAKQPSRAEQRTWKENQKHKQLHEPRTRIILDDTGNVLQHRSRDLPPATPNSAPAVASSEQRHDQRAKLQSSDLLAERYQAMKTGMREETATLRSILACSSHSTTPLPVVDGEVLPPTTSPLLGTFSPHLVSHHLPTLFSYPVFHFGRDAYQPHFACCYTLNQAHQLLYRINQQLSTSSSSSSSSTSSTTTTTSQSSLPTPPPSPQTPSPTPSPSYLYAYHIGTGIGRLASHADGPHPTAGERLLVQLQASHVTNAMVVVTCGLGWAGLGRAGGGGMGGMGGGMGGVGGGGVGRVVEVEREKVRCVVRVAKGMVREWQRCVEELKSEELTGVQQASGQAKEQGWETKDGSANSGNGDATTATTFITQPVVEELETDVAGEDEAQNEPQCTLPHPAPLIPRLTHTARINHYLYTLSTTLPALTPPPPPRTTPTATYWTLPSLRADLLAVLFPTAQPSSASAFVGSASVLALRWVLLPCLEQEREWMVGEEVWEGVSEWCEKEASAGRVRQQWVEGGWSLVRRGVWDVYVRQMKFMHSTYRQADMEAMAAMDNPPLIVRLLLLAVGGVLGWPQLQWVDVIPHLTGLRAVPPLDIFAEFPPPPGPPSSLPPSPPSSVASSMAYQASRYGSSPYEHSRVVTNPLMFDDPSAADAAAAGGASSSGPVAQLTTQLMRYSSYRSDLLAHLLSFDLFGLTASSLQRLQGVLCEHALAPSELPALEKHIPGSRWLVEWLVLVVRCNRAWQLCRQVFMVQVDAKVAQGEDATRGSTASSERRPKRSVLVADVEIEHDSSEEDEDEEVWTSVPGSAATDRGWTASRVTSAVQNN